MTDIHKSIIENLERSGHQLNAYGVCMHCKRGATEILGVGALCSSTSDPNNLYPSNNSSKGNRRELL